MSRFPLLTIAIPTYNRPAQLSRCLNSVLNQNVKKNNFEIVITDNSDNYESQKVVNEFILSTNIPTYYFKNEKNIGLDANLHEVVLRSNGHFVQWLSDDDEILPNALEVVLNKIENIEHQNSFLILNSKGFWESNNTRTWNKPFLNEMGSNYFSIPEDALFEFSSYMTFLSAFCFNRKLWLKSTEKKYFGTNLYLTYNLISYISIHRNIYIIRQPIVAQRNAFTGNFPLLKPFTIELQNALLNHGVKCGLSIKRTKNIYNKILSDFVFNLILGYKLGYFKASKNLSLYNDVIVPCWKNSIFWFKIFPIIITPNYILKFLQTLKRKF